MQWSAFITGLVLSASLIIAIGAQNAFVLRQGLRREHVLAIVVFCALADFVLISVGVSGVAAVLGDSRLLTNLLTVGGALFLSWYGVQAFRNAFRPRELHAGQDGGRRSLRSILAQAAGFTFLNPHVYLDTILLLGSIGARQPADARVWFIGGAAVASGAWFSSLGFGARLLAPVFAKPIAWRVLDFLIGVTMLALVVMLLVQTFRT
jgi:L-lysine exporter family protein LysE/ArgO